MSENQDNLGNLAYYDTLYNGLVPCKVTGIRVYNEFGHYEVHFTITADRGAYKRGERLLSSPLHVIPRKMVSVRNGHYGIRPNYAWVNDDNGTYAIVNKRS